MGILESLNQIIINESVVNSILNVIKKVAGYFKINLKQFTNPENIKNFVNANKDKLQVAKQLYDKIKTKKESNLHEGVINDFLGQNKVVIILTIFMFIIGIYNQDAAMEVQDFLSYSKEIAERLDI